MRFMRHIKPSHFYASLWCVTFNASL
jgi:hypothetical protein